MPHRDEDSTPYAGFDYLAASRHPFETFLLALALVSGVPLLFGVANNRVVEQALPPLLVHLWGAFLMLGSATALVGTYWRGTLITGFVLERSGLVGVGGAAAIYSAAIVAEVGLQGTYAACITFGFALACLAQAQRISRRLSRFMTRVRRNELYREPDSDSGSGG